MMTLLLVESRQNILSITINRPEKRNALSRELIGEIASAFTAGSEREDVAVAVLRGCGTKAFASGGDLDELNAIKTEAQAAAFAAETRNALDTIRRFPVPVIAVLNGHALGGGAELALACDLRLALAHSKIGFLQARLNIATAWGGGSDLFQLVGPSRALELLCTAELLDAQRASMVGLVDAVAPPSADQEVFVSEYVGRFAAQKPQVMRAFKSLAIMHRFGAGPADKAVNEGARFARTWAHEDHWAAVSALGR
jgi:enoyl-CoA hydratase